MKLVKCYVSSFGKLQDFTYDFCDNLNTIKQDNGWGKSTLATFIKVMFYGFSGGVKRSLDYNERKKYKPWNFTGAYGGYVIFQWGENEYKLERYFGNKESEDTVGLTDVKSGKKFSNTENLGKRIFEIDEEGFLSTTYYSQKDFEVKSNSSLTAKFNSVFEVENSDAFDKALLRVEQKAKTYKYSGERGLIADAKRELFNVNEEIERANRSDETVKVLKKEAEQLQEEVAILKKQTTMLTERVALAGKAEADAIKRARHKELLEEKKQLEQSKALVDAVFTGYLPKEDEIYDYYKLTEQLTATVTNAKMLQEEIEEIKSRQQDNKKTTRKNFSLCLIVFTALFFGLGIATIWFNLVLGVIGFSLTTISAFWLIASVILSKKNDKIDVYKNILSERENKFNSICIDAENYKTKLDGFLATFNVPDGHDYRSAIDYVKTAIIKQAELSKRLEEVCALIKGIVLEIGELNQSSKVENIALLRQELYDLQNKYAEKSNDLASKLSAIKGYEEIIERLCDLEIKKFEIGERIERYKDDYSILNKTAEYLKKADENLKIKYRAPLQSSLNKYLQMIVDDGVHANIDIDMNVTIEEKIGEKQTEYYSKGYRNLFEICKRFALTDVLFTSEKPFIILDDPFYNLDDEKLSSALELIKKLSSEYQILYLICHESRRV